MLPEDTPCLEFILDEFQWAPTLGGECYTVGLMRVRLPAQKSFNGHPPLGVNATKPAPASAAADGGLFQWAPTLGGECYGRRPIVKYKDCEFYGFNGHPPLGVNATSWGDQSVYLVETDSFNGHPPLGVNATV